jgi:WD40 repeat protein
VPILGSSSGAKPESTWASLCELDHERLVHAATSRLLGVSWDPEGKVMASFDSSGKVALWKSKVNLNGPLFHTVHRHSGIDISVALCE